jgi:hypothetical protein
VIGIYQPRYSKVCAVLKQIQSTANKQSIERLVYQPINSPCSPHKQTTFDLALAKIGGIKQMLMLIADVNIFFILFSIRANFNYLKKSLLVTTMVHVKRCWNRYSIY